MLRPYGFRIDLNKKVNFLAHIPVPSSWEVEGGIVVYYGSRRFSFITPVHAGIQRDGIIRIWIPALAGKRCLSVRKVHPLKSLNTLASAFGHSI